MMNQPWHLIELPWGVVHDISATLSGTGSATASVTVDVISAATLTGIGSLVGDVNLDILTDSTLTGLGDATADVNTTSEARLAVSSNDLQPWHLLLLPTAIIVHDISATLTGNGALTASVSLDISASVVLSGTGTLSSSVSIDVIVSSIFTGTGALTSSVVLDIPASSILTGSGALTGSVTTQPEIHADMPGNGTLSATVTVVSSAQPTPGSYKPRVTDYPKLPKYDRVRRRVVKVHAVLVNLKLRLSLRARVTSLINIAASLIVRGALKAKVSVETTLYEIKLTTKNTHKATVLVVHNISSILRARASSTATVFINTLPESKLTARIKATASVDIDTENEDLALLFDDIAEFLDSVDDETLVGVQ